MKQQLNVEEVGALLTAVGNAMLEQGAELSELDGALGDGDMGVTITIAFRTVKKMIRKEKFGTIEELLSTAAERIAEEAPSTFGTLLSAMLNGAGRSCGASAGTVEFRDALTRAAEAVMNRGSAKPGDKTLLDALVPACEAVKKAVREGAALPDCAMEAAKAAELGAEETINMRAVVGRAGYMGDRTIGVKDPGAAAIAMMLAVTADHMATDE